MNLNTENWARHIISAPAPEINSAHSMSTKKGYVFGFVQPTSPDFAKYPAMVGPTIALYGGKIRCKQQLQDALYKEDEGNLKAMFVLEFPSLVQATEWYKSSEYAPAKELRLSTSKGPLVILEGDIPDHYTGFCGLFVEVNDPQIFSRYSPAASLKEYQAVKCAVKITDAQISEDAENYDMAVLLAFPSGTVGKQWMDSDAYQTEKSVRLLVTFGPVAIIGADQ